LKLNIHDETSPLRAVILGTAVSTGPVPKIEHAYDPKSIEHIKAGTYPKEIDMVREMEALNEMFQSYAVQVFRPQILNGYNQIFTRDIAFVIEDIFIKSNILPDRAKEIDAISQLIAKVAPLKVITACDDVHIEGGDVILWGNYIFVGVYRESDYSDMITARTNEAAIGFLENLFPHKTVKAFDLVKSSTDAFNNALHLDCCFQPVGKDRAIIHKEGFKNKEDYEFLCNLFGIENLFHISKQEMYAMNSNVFSITPEVVVSETNFVRLNSWLRSKGFTVEEVDYAEIGKQEGLFRCSTLPLIRDNPKS